MPPTPIKLKPVKAPDKPSQSDLLARVTGKIKEGVTAPLPPAPTKPLAAMPPSDKPLPPGVTGTPPMPTNKVVGAIAPSSLTEAEREALIGIGWTEDIPIPPNFADAFDSIKAEQMSKPIPLPVDPKTPPLKVTTVPADQVDPETRERLRAVMTKMTNDVQDEATQAQEDAQRQLRESVIPGLREARATADRAAKASAESQEPVIEVPAKPTPASAAAPSPTGADARPATCPHCAWNLSQDDIPEPAQATKLAFVHCLLGQKPFTQSVELLGGAIEVIFRSLTIDEVEACYVQTFADQAAGKIGNELDYWERINRYRLFLQLQTLRAVGPNGFVHELPDGLSKQANPGAQATWQDGNEESLTVSETLLPMIEQHITENVLKQEAVFRIVNTACNRFNRLVSKLEAMADNSDFWKPTGVPS